MLNILSYKNRNIIQTISHFHIVNVILDSSVMVSNNDIQLNLWFLEIGITFLGHCKFKVVQCTTYWNL